MGRMTLLYAIMILTIFIASCGSNQPKAEFDYEQTKRIVVDILKTDEGKKVLQETLTEEKMKQHLIMEADIVKESINEMFTSETGKNMWKNLFEDPSFVENFSKSVAQEQEKLFKHLMNDATFQKQLLELLQNPEMTNQTLTVLKSQQFRQHLEETIQQTLENPLYQAKIQTLLLKAAEQQKAKSEQESGGSGGGSEESGRQ